MRMLAFAFALPLLGVFVLLFTLLPVSHVAAQTCVNPPSDLVSWWPGDGNADDVQNVNDGTLQGGTTFAAGMVGPAFSFNGVDAFVEAPENGSLDFNGPFTIDLWVNPNTTSAEKSPLVSKYDFSGSIWPNVAYELSLIGPDQVIQFGITCGTTNMFRQTVPNVLPLNVFSHVAAVYRQDPSPALEIFVNGQLQPGTDLGGICSFINQHDIPFRIGKRIDAGFGSVLFDGLIDEVEIFDRALTAGEIHAIYDAGSAGKCNPLRLDVSIDIKPGSDPNAINPRSKGFIPVAILTTDDFDASTVDPSTVMFGPDNAVIGHMLAHFEDVDDDADIDLVFHVLTSDTGIACGDTSASLTGMTFGGEPIQGFDSIKTVGCK